MQTLKVCFKCRTNEFVIEVEQTDFHDITLIHKYQHCVDCGKDLD